ncbi:MAG: amino acid permease [Bacteroidetes bacterium]|jgi:basic amino acid/polyamine antiporter, APA family|nr:amino acid permease [Bacteroidota bacterium]MBT3750266.1 amino acid permease [Bacteroidota bacterium]MBT4400455.1 amino acid permease [Bacteroidota bacterium]MBT4410343.1 amino acid permease [Bacteroidota bacterium]MBT5427421.1 amino acid permease [Bacteroidota bacterium]
MTELRKELSLYGLTMIAIGSCIGSGIFLTPSLIAAYLPNVWFIMAVWLIGGLITLTGALTFAELGSIFPQAGGVYIYLKQAYGDFVGFLYGWAYLTVINTGALAALSIAFASYLGFFFPLEGQLTTIVAISVIILVTLINLFRVKFSEYFANVFSGFKIIGILAVIAVGLFAGDANLNDWSLQSIKMEGNIGIKAFGLALVGVLWSFGGWQHTSFLSGEAKNAARNVPKAMVIAAIVVTVIYILTNIGYLHLMPIVELSQSDSLAADAISKVISIGGALVAVLIAVSVFGTAGIYTMTCPRIYYAMANDGLFFKGMAKISPKYHTPVNAILVQSALAIVILLLWGTFEEVITYVVFTDWIFFAMAATTIFVFRKRYPKVHRPVKTFAYPVTPIIFIIITTGFVINTFFEKPAQAYAGLALLIIAYPIFRYFKNKSKQSNK